MRSEVYMKFTIDLKTIDKVKKFCEYAIELKEDIYLLQGRYVIDGKSIMGIFSLDLTRNIEIQIDEVKDDFYDFFEKIKDLGVICVD